GHQIAPEAADRIVDLVKSSSAPLEHPAQSLESRSTEARQDRGPAGTSDGRAVTAGHRTSLKMLQDVDGIRVTSDLYRELATPAGVYLRPTDGGLTVISLDPECAAMVGVGTAGASEHKLKT